MSTKEPNKAKREGRVFMYGTWVSQKGAEIYRLLGSGMKMKDVSEAMGIPMGSMQGYMQRAVQFGVIGRRKGSVDVIAESEFDGHLVRFSSVKEIEDALFNYSTVYRSCRNKACHGGFKWRFGPNHGARMMWHGRMISHDTARFYNECMSQVMEFGDITKIGRKHGLNQHSSLVAYRKLCSWGLAKSVHGGYKLVGKSEKLGIVEFESMADAERGGFSRKCIHGCLKGKQKKHAGYKWERLNVEDRSQAE